MTSLRALCVPKNCSQRHPPQNGMSEEPPKALETQSAVRGMEKRQQEAEVSQEAWMARRSWSSERAFRCTFYTQRKKPFVYKPRVTRKALHVVCLKFHPRLGRQFQPTQQAEVGSQGGDESPSCLLPSESSLAHRGHLCSFCLRLHEDRGFEECI